jgi:hypothetical protein
MQLLLARNQETRMRRLLFTLWAKFEITKTEVALIDKYGMHGAVIREGDIKRDVKKAAIYSGAFWAVIAFGFIIYARPSFTQIIGIFIQFALIPFPLTTWFVYSRIREKIIVRDMLDGRTFTCNNISILLEKEEYLKQTAERFRMFLERMEKWGGQDVVMIEPNTQTRIVAVPHAAE